MLYDFFSPTVVRGVTGTAAAVAAAAAAGACCCWGRPAAVSGVDRRTLRPPTTVNPRGLYWRRSIDRHRGQRQKFGAKQQQKNAVDGTDAALVIGAHTLTPTAQQPRGSKSAEWSAAAAVAVRGSGGVRYGRCCCQVAGTAATMTASNAITGHEGPIDITKGD